MSRSDHYRIPLQRELTGGTSVFHTGCKGKWLWFTGMPLIFGFQFWGRWLSPNKNPEQQTEWWLENVKIQNRLIPPFSCAQKAAESAEQSAGCSFWTYNYLKAVMKEVISHEVSNSRGLNINSQGVSPSPMLIKIYILILRGRTVIIWLVCPSVAKGNKKSLKYFEHEGVPAGLL